MLPPKSNDGPQETTPGKCILTLAGSVGVPESHPSTPSILPIKLESKQRPSHAGLPHNMTNSPTMSVISTLSNGAIKSTKSGNTNTATNNTLKEMADDETINTTGGADIWPFKEALQTKRIVLIEDCSALIDGYQVRIWDELPNAAVVVPVANDSDQGVPSAVIVIGLSIRRPFDEDYESFLVSPRSR